MGKTRIPEHIRHQVVSYANFISKTESFANDLASVGFTSFNALAQTFLDEESFSLTLCTYCQHAELYFDFLHPSDIKTPWRVAVKVSIRCAKLMEKFTIRYVYFDSNLKDEEFTTPGQLTYRSYCPRFETYKKPEENADAQED